MQTLMQNAKESLKDQARKCAKLVVRVLQRVKTFVSQLRQPK